jgi:hypothetical protein
MFPAEMKLEKQRLFRRSSTAIGVPAQNLKGTVPHFFQDEEEVRFHAPTNLTVKDLARKH